MPLVQDALTALHSLEWTAPRVIDTREGQRQIRTAVPTREFWELWREHRAAVSSAGMSVSKNGTGQYIVTEWKMPGGDDTPLARKVREEAEADTEAALAVPDVEIDERGLMPHQPPAVKRLVAALRKHNAALDASGTGVGKTYQALSAAIHMGGPVAVVCPKAVIPGWERAFAHFGARPLFVLNYERLRGWSNRWCAPRLDRKGFLWTVPEDTTLIFDEAHVAKGWPPTRNAWLLMSAHREGVRCLLLSATLATGPQEMWASGRVLGLYQDHFVDWIQSMGCQNLGGRRWHYRGGGRGIAALHRQLFPGRGNRLRHEDIADFPKIIICNIRAGGVGISLHDTTGRHPRLALICPTFSASDLLQACGRCHRAGGGDVVTKIVFAARTIEERAMEAVKVRLENLDRLNDGELTLSTTLVTAERAPAEREAEEMQAVLI